MSHDTLTQLGFNEKEIAVYTTLLQHNALSPAEIARLTNINRTTVYSTAKELTKKGLLNEDLGGSTRRFVALSPKNLEYSLQKEQKKLENKKLYVMRAIRELDVFSKESKYSVPKIVFVEEEDIESHLYRQAPLWNKSMKERNAEFLGFQDASFVTYFEEWIDWYWTKEESSNTVVLKLLSNEKTAHIKKKGYSRRHMEFWDKTDDFTATTWIMGDYTTIIMTNEHPHYLVEIHDKTIAHNMRQVFKGLWEEVIETN
jgi:sugar-specific transcriptional regulator TrmB